MGPISRHYGPPSGDENGRRGRGERDKSVSVLDVKIGVGIWGEITAWYARWGLRGGGGGGMNGTNLCPVGVLEVKVDVVIRGENMTVVCGSPVATVAVSC